MSGRRSRRKRRRPHSNPRAPRRLAARVRRLQESRDPDPGPRGARLWRDPSLRLRWFDRDHGPHGAARIRLSEQAKGRVAGVVVEGAARAIRVHAPGREAGGGARLRARREVLAPRRRPPTAFARGICRLRRARLREGGVESTARSRTPIGLHSLDGDARPLPRRGRATKVPSLLEARRTLLWRHPVEPPSRRAPSGYFFLAYLKIPVSSLPALRCVHSCVK